MMLPRSCTFARSSGTADGQRQLTFLATYDVREASEQLVDSFPFAGKYEVVMEAVLLITVAPGPDEQRVIGEIPQLFRQLRERLLKAGG